MESNTNENIYGVCGICGSAMQPVFFIEEEVCFIICKTGRKRKAVSELTCPDCFNSQTVDGSFDGPWY